MNQLENQNPTARAAKASDPWWKLAGLGAAVLLATVLAVTLTGEVREGWWWPMVLAFLGGAAAIVTGLVVGIARLRAPSPAD